MSQLHIETFVAPAFAQNGYIVWREGEASAVAIDPGSEPDAMADALARHGLWLEAILLTHAHIDHIEGVARLVARTGAATYMHTADGPFYQRADMQAAQFGMEVDALPPIDHPLEDASVIRLAGIDFDVRHVPGHSPGHVILYVADAGVAFVGDVVFQGSVGRTDLPGGSFPQLIGGIRKHVLTLPDDTVLHTGHGPPTTVGHERVSNPFLVPHYGGGFA
jgi:glyoxylase-like metal-dependent hydrolase (beta-lactamase superfamily II)